MIIGNASSCSGVICIGWFIKWCSANTSWLKLIQHNTCIEWCSSCICTLSYVNCLLGGGGGTMLYQCLDCRAVAILLVRMNVWTSTTRAIMFIGQPAMEGLECVHWSTSNQVLSNQSVVHAIITNSWSTVKSTFYEENCGLSFLLQVLKLLLQIQPQRISLMLSGQLTNRSVFGITNPQPSVPPIMARTPQ